MWGWAEIFQRHLDKQGRRIQQSLQPELLGQATECCPVLSHSVVSNSLPPHGLQPARLLCPWGFSRQEYWCGLPCPPSGDLPNPGIDSRSPELQADSLLSEPEYWNGQPIPSPGDLLHWGLLHCRSILYQLSHKGSPGNRQWIPKWSHIQPMVQENCHLCVQQNLVSGMLPVSLRYLFIYLPGSQWQHTGYLVVACRIQFSDQRSNLGPLYWESRVLATGPPGRSLSVSDKSFI